MIVNKEFIAALAALNGQKKPENRRRFFLAHDQLNVQLLPAPEKQLSELSVLFVENRWWARRRPYHKMKLAFVWANQRHFALELARLGVWVDYQFADAPFAEVIQQAIQKGQELEAIEPAERELAVEIEPFIKSGALKLHPHGGWLTTPKQFESCKTKQSVYLMDSFYRTVRKDSGILMEKNGDYVGGKVSFDGENREPWKKGKDPLPPPFPRFKPDAITAEVFETLRQDFADHPGELDQNAVPATLNDAEAYWDFFVEKLLPNFGTYEDAMSSHSTSLFHSKISTLLNLTRLMPLKLVKDVETSSAPLNCREGFIRQVLGWREFVRHVHRETDGFRTLETTSGTACEKPGNAGYARWSGKAWPHSKNPASLDGGSEASYLDSQFPVPPAFWGASSGLNCLDSVVKNVWDEGWSHHITRLMVLSNLATLLDVSPRELADWFWVAYSDAWDWVVEPNVMAMGTYGVGPLMTTKPYIAGAAYIDKMSDYCGGCSFNPKTTCPVTRLYWAFLARHKNQLENNPRLRMPYSSLGKRSAEKREEDEAIFLEVKDALQRGESLASSEFFS